MQHGSDSTLRIPRRIVLKSLVGLAAASACSIPLKAWAAVADKQPVVHPSVNPKWYGFNLLEYFSTDADWMKHFPYQNDGQFKEDDFRWIRDWGFNWVRLPMDYRFWTDPKDPMKIDEKKIEAIDRAIKLGEKYGVHVNLCLHRAPGACILDTLDEKVTGIHITPEKTNLYTDPAALDAFVHQWVFFASRYAGISSDKLSFNLINEPGVLNGKRLSINGEKEYARVARAAITAIRAKDPKRTIVTDGYNWGRTPVDGLYDTGIVQSCHDYSPMPLTHYHVEWARSPGWDTLPVPTWPLEDKNGRVMVDPVMLEAEFRPWAMLAEHKIPIHFGEMGCGRYTPPDVVYGWMEASLQMINNLHSGWALWNFRGPYGVLDTNRAGTDYKDWYGHKLDHKLLKIMQDKMKG